MKRVFIAFILFTLSLNVYLQGYLPQEQLSTGERENSLPWASPASSVQEAELLVFPNPVTGEEIRFNQVIRAEVFNVLGLRVQTVTDQNHLNVSAFKKGIYVLRTQEGQIRRFVIGE